MNSKYLSVSNWKNIILFQSPNAVTNYKIRFATYLALVPLFCSFVLLALVLIFSKLNLYYLEGSGVIIDPQVRTAYYDQMIMETAPLLGYFCLLLVLTFAVGWIMLNWATHPFVQAEQNIRSILKGKKRKPSAKNWQMESIDFEETVNAYIEKKTGMDSKKDGLSKKPVIRYNLNYKFLLKFISVFLPLSIISSLVMRILVESIYGKIVSLALNLLHLRTIHSHYILAQQEVLQDTQSIMLFISLVAYGFIGRLLSHHISTMIFVFTRAIRENRFPIRLRPTDVYHGLAEALNEFQER